METVHGDADTADRRQARNFCEVLHREIDALGDGIAKLEASMERMSNHRMLGAHLASARNDLRLALDRRNELLGMLDALGHAYPCRHD